MKRLAAQVLLRACLLAILLTPQHALARSGSSAKGGSFQPKTERSAPAEAPPAQSGESYSPSTPDPPSSSSPSDSEPSGSSGDGSIFDALLGLVELILFIIAHPIESAVIFGLFLIFRYLDKKGLLKRWF